MAYLLMEPPGYGKSTITRGLFPGTGVKVISGDELILQVARGKRSAPEDLSALLARDFSPYRIDQSVQRVFDSGLGPDLVRLFAGEAERADFALDGYIPEAHHADVEQVLAQEGFLPVRMKWQRPSAPVMSSDALEALTRGYLDSFPGIPPSSAPAGGRGFVDSLEAEGEGVLVRGWAVGPEHSGPESIELSRGGRRISAAVVPERRQDVQRKLQLPSSAVGFSAAPACPREWADDPSAVLKVVAVFAGGARVELAYSSAFEKRRARGGAIRPAVGPAPQE